MTELISYRITKGGFPLIAAITYCIEVQVLFESTRDDQGERPSLIEFIDQYETLTIPLPPKVFNMA